jgi:hypothetical protein
MMLCQCVLSFHSPWSSFQDLLVATENLTTGVPFTGYPGLGILADESDDLRARQN